MPQLGFVLGSLAGSALFPTQLPAGPRITDNRTTTSSIGEPVPIVFGTADVAGTVIWLAPFVEHSHEEGGKGGPEQQTFSYTQSIAIGLCERVDDDADDTTGAIAGVSRIWENGTIVYDVRPQREANTDLGLEAESDLDYANRLTASAAYAEGFVLHLGTEDQLPDATIEAIEGIGNVPAFRGLAYIVFPDRNLSVAQGLRHPNFTFEVFQDGIGDCTESTLLSNEVLHPWEGGGSSNPINPLNTNDFVITFADTALPGHSGLNFSLHYSTEAEVIEVLRGTGLYPNTLQYLGYVYGGGGNLDMPQAGGPIISDRPGLTPDPTAIHIHYNFTQPDSDHGFISKADATAGSVPGKTVPLATWSANGHLEFNSGVLGPSGPLISPYTNQFSGLYGSGYWIQVLGDALVDVTRSPGIPVSICAGLPPSLAIPGYAVRDDGRLIKCNEWELVFDPSNSPKVLQNYVGTDPAIYPLGPTLLIGDPNYSSSSFWTAAYNDAVTKGLMPAGKVYGVDYPQGQATGSYWRVQQVICEASGNGVTVGSIVQAVCKRAGLTEIDVSDLTQIIPGYSVSGICDAADIISPLRSVAFFDCVESGEVMKFPTRGKPVVATLDTDDFGCFDGGSTGGDGSSSSNVPAAITTQRGDETTLPRSIRLHYKALSRDYQDAEADSPFRLATTAVDDQDISIPIVLTDLQAAQSAEIIWSDAWAAKNSHELSIDQAWSHLEPGDCIGVPIDGVIQRLRIVSDSNAAGILRKLSCVRDDQGSYISFAVAQPPQVQPQTLKLVSPTSAEFLDLPCLRDADSDPGFYVAAQRLNGAGNSWKGATIYKSVDGGATFTALFSLITEATIGALVSPIPVSQAFDWDTDTVIDVTVASSVFTFESRTDDAVLAGANAAAVGDDGRWEIIQFANAIKISDTHWQLSRLLRGRRGTEHVIGSSHAGDRFIMVSTGDLGRAVLQVSEIGAARVYKAVSIGASFSSGVNYDFSGHGQALVPFSPVDPTAEFQTDGDILINWTRRSRIGRTLMSGVDIPLGETSESFQVDILDPASPDSPETVLRTLASSTTSVVYSSAQQVTDFGSPPSEVRVAIYQMSSIVGRGTPVVATISL